MILCSMVSFLALGDEIELLTGDRHKGKVLEETAEFIRFRIDLAEGETVETKYPADKVHALTIEGTRRVITELPKVDPKVPKKDPELMSRVAAVKFRQEYENSATEAQRIQLIEQMRGLAFEKIIRELAIGLQDAEPIALKAIEVISEMDHPASADVLTAAVATSLASPELARALATAAAKCKWDKFHAELSTKLFERVFDPNLSSVAYRLMLSYEQAAPVSAIDPLIKALAKVEDIEAKAAAAGRGGKNDKYMEQMKKTLEACTGEKKSNSKEYEAWWKQNKAALLAKARVVHWCKATGKRWDRVSSDAKAYCPHHGDKVLAKKDPVIVAFTTFK